MADRNFIHAALRRREVVQALGLWGTALLLQGCLTTGDVEQLVSVQNFQKLFGGQKLGPQEELQMGNTLYGPTIDQAGGAYRNSHVQTAMREFAAPLFRNGAKPDLPWEVTVLDDNTVNAWALPGGKLAVNKGLLRYVDSDAELASVLGHEMGHVIKSHAVQELETERFTTDLTDIGKSFLASKAEEQVGASQLAPIGNVVGVGNLTREALTQLQAPLVGLVVSGYSRSHEYEADSNILEVFGRTGHDPARSYTFFQTLLEIIPAGTKATTSLYSTHPATEARIDRLREEAARMPAGETARPSDAFARLKRTFPTRRAAPPTV